MMEEPVSILLVEDDEVDIMNVKRAFNKNKLSNPIHIARNGLEALELLTNAKISPHPKVVLLDINMPKMGGIEFLTEIRKNPDLKHLSVFVMTTSNQDSDVIAAYNLNVAGYILKPISFESFIEAVGVLNLYWKLCLLPPHK
jgi:CheY-like chemotaxis protein